MINKKKNLILRSGLAYERALKLCGLLWLVHGEQRSDKNEIKNVICNY